MCTIKPLSKMNMNERIVLKWKKKWVRVKQMIAKECVKILIIQSYVGPKSEWKKRRDTFHRKTLVCGFSTVTPQHCSLHAAEPAFYSTYLSKAKLWNFVLSLLITDALKWTFTKSGFSCYKQFLVIWYQMYLFQL